MIDVSAADPKRLYDESFESLVVAKQAADRVALDRNRPIVVVPVSFEGGRTWRLATFNRYRALAGCEGRPVEFSYIANPLRTAARLTPPLTPQAI